MLNRGVMGWQQQAGRALVHGLCSQWDTNKWGILCAPFASSSILFLGGWQNGSPWRALLIQLELYMVPRPPFLYYYQSSGEHYTYACECTGVPYRDPELTGQWKDQVFACCLQLKHCLLWLHSVDLSDFSENTGFLKTIREVKELRVHLWKVMLLSSARNKGFLAAYWFSSVFRCSWQKGRTK